MKTNAAETNAAKTNAAKTNAAETNAPNTAEIEVFLVAISFVAISAGHPSAEMQRMAGDSCHLSQAISFGWCRQAYMHRVHCDPKNIRGN